MPSPFPGIDPYLEGDLWSSFHHELLGTVKHQLGPKLKPRYFPFTEKYFLAEAWEALEIAQGAMYLDVGIAKLPFEGPAMAPTAVLEAPLQLSMPMRRLVPQFRIEIRDVERRRLVTVLEFLSPANKNNPGRKQYLRMRAKIIHSPVHLVEFDLLRRGRRLPMKGDLPDGDYVVYVSRSEQRPPAGVWPILLNQSLPTVPIPLLPGDPDVNLDLQRAVQESYDSGDFSAVIDYRKPTAAGLTATQEAWADPILRKAGLR